MDMMVTIPSTGYSQCFKKKKIERSIRDELCSLTPDWRE